MSPRRLHLYGGVVLNDGHSIAFYSLGPAPYRYGPPAPVWIAAEARAQHPPHTPRVMFDLEWLGSWIVESSRAPDFSIC